MSIITRLVDQIRDNRAQTAMQYRSAGNSIIPWTAGKPQWMRPTIERFDQDAYRKVGLAYRCIQYLSNATSSASLRVYEPDTDEADDSHPLRQLLDRPNAGMGGDRFLAFVAMVAAISGYCIIEKERDMAGRVIGLWPLRSDWIRVIPRQHAEPDWEYRVPGWREPFLLKAEDVIPFTWSDTPDGSPIGIGPVEIMLREAQISSALTDFLKVFMDRGALPQYMLIPSDDPKLSAQFNKPEAKDAFLEAFRQRYQGLGNASDPLLSPGIKDIKRIGFDFNELAYPELNALTDARICTAFGIPPILVGAQVGLDKATYSNYGQARTSFYEDTMSYLWSRLDDAFTRHLLPEFEQRPGWDIHFDTSGIKALQDNQNELWARTTAALQAGAISTHTYQRLVGIDPHGADVFLRSFNVVEIPNTTPGRAKRGDVHVHPANAIETTGHLRALPTHDPKAPRFVFREGRRYVNEARLSPVEREQRAVIADTARQTIVGLGDIVAPRLEAYFAEQKTRVLEGLNLRSGEGSIETRFAEAVDWASEDDLLRRIFAAWWETVSETALTNAETLLGLDISWSVTNPYIADVQGVLGQRIIDINATTRTQLEDLLTALMSEGTTVPEMGDAIRDLFDQTYANRHLTVARTESMMAYGTASTNAYEASGVVQRAELLDNPSHTTDPGSDGLTCSQRNHLIVPLAQVSRHLSAEHPNGTLAVSPVVTALGEV